MKEKKFQSNPKYFTIGVYVVAVFLCCAVIAKLIFSFSAVTKAVGTVVGVLVPFIAGIILAYLINPLYKFFDFKVFAKCLGKEKQRSARKTISLVISYIIILGLMVLVFSVVVPQFAASVVALVDSIKNFIPRIQDWITGLQTQFNDLDLEFLNDAINNLLPSIGENLKTWAESLVSSAVSATIGVVSGIVNAFLAIFVSIYVLADKIHLERAVRNIFYAVFDRPRAADVSRTVRECSTIFSNYFTGKIFDSLLVGIACMILMLIFRLPFALMVSVIVFITNIIPYFGPIVGAVLGCLIMLMSGWKEVIIFLIIDIVLQQLDGNVIGPKIIGNTTGLRPVWVLFAITFGAWVGGVAGMLIGVPIIAMIAHIVEKLVNRKLAARGLYDFVTEQETPQTISYSGFIGKIVEGIKNKFTGKKNTEKDQPGKSADPEEEPSADAETADLKEEASDAQTKAQEDPSYTDN